MTCRRQVGPDYLREWLFFCGSITTNEGYWVIKLRVVGFFYLIVHGLVSLPSVVNFNFLLVKVCFAFRAW